MPKACAVLGHHTALRRFAYPEVATTKCNRPHQSNKPQQAHPWNKTTQQSGVQHEPAMVARRSAYMPAIAAARRRGVCRLTCSSLSPTLVPCRAWMDLTAEVCSAKFCKRSTYMTATATGQCQQQGGSKPTQYTRTGNHAHTKHLHSHSPAERGQAMHAHSNAQADTERKQILIGVCTKYTCCRSNRQ